MKIETPQNADYERIAQIHNEAVKPFLDIYSPQENESFGDLIFETGASIAELAENRQIIVAKSDSDSVVGYAAFRKKNGYVVWISELYVDPVEQGKGYGRVLLEVIEKWAKSEGCKLVALETHKNATWALNFYIKNGYGIVNDKVSEFPYSEILEKPPVPNRPLIAKLFK